MTTDWGATPSVWVKTSSTWVTLAFPFAPATGKDTLVPPWKSMPKVNPRSTMLAAASATSRPVIRYHSFRLPTTSKAPVPV